MVVERDPTVVLEATGARLADVVQQRGQAEGQVGTVLLQFDRLLQNDQRVFVDVLVPVVLVALQAEGGKLGQDVVGEPGVDEQGQPLAGVRGEDQLVQLVPHPFGRDDLDPPGHLRHRRDDLGCDLEVELRGEACRPHHPQGVIGEGLLGGTRGPQYPGREVVETAVRVDEHLLRERDSHRVHREVPPDEILLDGVAVRHLGLARGPVVRLGPVGGDLDLVAVLLRPDGAEGDPDLPHGVRPRPDDLQYVLGTRVRREVQVVAEPLKQRVPDRTADQGEREPGLLETAGEVVGDGSHPQQLAHRAVLHLAQGTGVVFVGVRHNRKGYVAPTTAGASIIRASADASIKRARTRPLIPAQALPLRRTRVLPFIRAHTGRSVAVLRSCGPVRGTYPQRASLPCVDAHCDDH